MESSNLGPLHWERESSLLDDQESSRADSFKLQEIGRNHGELNGEKEGVGLPGGASGKESAYQCRRHGFNL